VQPIHIEDMCRAIISLLLPQAPNKVCIPFVGPHPLSLRDIHTAFKHWLGIDKVRFLSVPLGLSLLATHLGGLFKNSPMNREAIEMLQRGNTTSVQPFVENLGFTPVGFKEALQESPAQQADHWHTRLVLLKPWLRWSIAFVWIYTAIISAFVYPQELSYQLLHWVGVPAVLAPFMLYTAALFDLLLGLATLMAYRMQLVGLLQIITMLGYTFIISLGIPEQWIHPFGAISKNFPLLVATLIMMVLERR
jgi:hypothetical protein